MMTVYRVRISADGKGGSVVVADRQMPASSAHHAVRQVVFGARRALPRGWVRLHIDVLR